MLLRLLLVLAFSCWCPGFAVAGDADPELPVEAPATPEEQALDRDIVRMLELSGSLQVAETMLDQMVGNFKNAGIAPEEFWNEFRSRLDPRDFVAICVPIYRSRFSREELAELIAFWETPTGQKLARLSPEITIEAMEAGRSWGEQVGARAMHALEQRGEK